MKVSSTPMDLAFQSTPSAWRVTDCGCVIMANVYISIHTLRVEGDAKVAAETAKAEAISIHTLRVIRMWAKIAFADIFQSTPSAWRVTMSSALSLMYPLFQSTPSAWRVTAGLAMYLFGDVFQSTPSAWRVTLSSPSLLRPWTNFNPHPPRGG